MNETLKRIIALIAEGEVLFSEHGYDEIAADGMSARDIVDGAKTGVVVEDYPDNHKGPCVLVLQQDEEGKPVHVVWGIPRGKLTPAVVVTGYRPDPDRWSGDFLRRKER